MPAEAIAVTGNRLTFRGKQYACTVGKGGFSTNKKEGDGATPVGIFPLRECWYRPDRGGQPQTALAVNPIRENDGWCDDPKSTQYNRHVRLPFAFSHEKLWRDDHAYDLIVPLGYNDDPVVPGRGSAIFLHVMHDSGRATEGCVALKKADLLEILALCGPGTLMEIKEI
jgi:L,D-peptidoglycan transpeptidase YkuD (ErfK/YbiS/YcfS/YnhG family)